MEEGERNSKAQGTPTLKGNLSPPQGPPSLMEEVCSSLTRETDFFFFFSRTFSLPSCPLNEQGRGLPPPSSPPLWCIPESGSSYRRTPRFPSPGTSLGWSAQDQGPMGVRHACPTAPCSPVPQMTWPAQPLKAVALMTPPGYRASGVPGLAGAFRT